MKRDELVRIVLGTMFCLGCIFVVCGMFAAVIEGFRQTPNTLWCVLGGFAVAFAAMWKLEGGE